MVVGAPPAGCFDFGDAVVHADLPADAVEEPVVVPAEKDAVVRQTYQRREPSLAGLSLVMWWGQSVAELPPSAELGSPSSWRTGDGDGDRS